MSSKKKLFTAKQLLFKEMFVGTFIYAVVLGFFDDYTSIVYADSFSTIFLASIVLQSLTYLAFMAKGIIIRILKHYKGIVYQLLMFFFVWLVMFLSKFVFVWAVDFIFGASMTIYGFFGIFAVVLSVTVLHRLADQIFIKLAD